MQIISRMQDNLVRLSFNDRALGWLCIGIGVGLVIHSLPVRRPAREIHVPVVGSTFLQNEGL